MSSISGYGYGTFIDRLTPRKSMEELNEIYKAFPEDLKEGYAGAWTLHRHLFDYEIEFLDWFVWNYSTGYGVNGTGALIAELINANEFGGRELFIGSCDWVFAELYLPVTEEAREKIPLVSEAEEVLRKYLRLFYSDADDHPIGYSLFKEEK